MDLPSNSTPTTILMNSGNSTDQTSRPASHNWEFLVVVLATGISVAILLAILAKCQVVRHYQASYRHTRLREGDNISQFDPSDVEFLGVIHEEDDDGFIEDHYIQSYEREKTVCGTEDFRDFGDMDDGNNGGDEKMDENLFSIS